MAAIFAFKCSQCGEVHEGSPSFGFAAPDQYAGLSPDQKRRMGMLNEDFCTITHDDRVDRFIRAVLEVPIHGAESPFLWGVWVSLSAESYARYHSTFNNPVEGDGFFGWLCNAIKVYPSPDPRPADVLVQMGRARPKVVLHRTNRGDDPLVQDQVHGISVARARELAERARHGV